MSIKVKVKVIPDSNFKCLDFYQEAVGGPLTECILVSYVDTHYRFLS